MEESQDCDKVGRATKSGQNFPESITVDGVEGLSQVNEPTKIMSVVPRDVLKPHWLSGSTSSDRGSKRLSRT